ncbi:MAG: DUF11 domain-containing protein [Flavobacteriales bacterium]|nr:DUF11 domain-containing protein [Flavobacteriales bacterium]
MTSKQRLLLLAFPFMVVNGAMALSVSINIEQQPLCSYPTGALSLNIGGGVPPYTYLWSNGETTSTLWGVETGTYSVTVTDGNLEEASASVDLTSTVYNEWPYLHLPFRAHCENVWPYSNFAIIDQWSSSAYMGPPPYYFNGQELSEVEPGVFYGTIQDFPGQEFTIEFTDANGCAGIYFAIAQPSIDWPTIAFLNIEGSCSAYPTGRATFAHSAEGYGRDVTYELTGLGGQGGDVLPGMAWYGSSAGTRLIDNLPPGDYRMRQRTSGLYNAECYDDHFFTIPDLGLDCGLLSSRAFMDYNLNCTRQSNEPYVPFGILEILPGPVYITSGPQGQYSVALPVGNYTLEQQSTVLLEHCTGGPIPFTISANSTTTVNLPDTSAVPLDVYVSLHSGTARPGFELIYSMSVRNQTPAASGATSVTFTFDPVLEYQSASPAPSSVSGNTITWNQSQLTAFQQRSYQVRFEVPPDVGLLGYELVANASVSTANTDGNPANNSATNLRTITGAYDPNDKLAYTSSGSTDLWLINEDEWIDYTIRFQNTGTDTAFNVVITDTLPPNLDPASIIIGAASHNFTWELRDAGTLKFYFPNILLPDSNINEPRSHGFVGFRIRPHLPLLPGDEIINIANIYFDFNPPVITDPSLLVATTSTGVVERSLGGPSLFPNPATDHLRLVWPDAAGRTGTWSILALDGRWISRGTIVSNDHRIDIGSMASGMYMLRVQADGIETTHPFIRTEQ